MPRGTMGSLNPLQIVKPTASSFSPREELSPSFSPSFSPSSPSFSPPFSPSFSPSFSKRRGAGFDLYLEAMVDELLGASVQSLLHLHLRVGDAQASAGDGAGDAAGGLLEFLGYQSGHPESDVENSNDGENPDRFEDSEEENEKKYSFSSEETDHFAEEEERQQQMEMRETFEDIVLNGEEGEGEKQGEREGRGDRSRDMAGDAGGREKKGESGGRGRNGEEEEGEEEEGEGEGEDEGNVEKEKVLIKFTLKTLAEVPLASPSSPLPSSEPLPVNGIATAKVIVDPSALESGSEKWKFGEEIKFASLPLNTDQESPESVPDTRHKETGIDTSQKTAVESTTELLVQPVEEEAVPGSGSGSTVEPEEVDPTAESSSARKKVNLAIEVKPAGSVPSSFTELSPIGSGKSRSGGSSPLEEVAATLEDEVRKFLEATKGRRPRWQPESFRVAIDAALSGSTELASSGALRKEREGEGEGEGVGVGVGVGEGVGVGVGVGVGEGEGEGEGDGKTIVRSGGEVGEGREGEVEGEGREMGEERGGSEGGRDERVEKVEMDGAFLRGGDIVGVGEGATVGEEEKRTESGERGEGEGGRKEAEAEVKDMGPSSSERAVVLVVEPLAIAERGGGMGEGKQADLELEHFLSIQDEKGEKQGKEWKKGEGVGEGERESKEKSEESVDAAALQLDHFLVLEPKEEVVVFSTLSESKALEKGDVEGEGEGEREGEREREGGEEGDAAMDEFEDAQEEFLTAPNEGTENSLGGTRDESISSSLYLSLPLSQSEGLHSNEGGEGSPHSLNPPLPLVRPNSTTFPTPDPIPAEFLAPVPRFSTETLHGYVKDLNTTTPFPLSTTNSSASHKKQKSSSKISFGEEGGEGREKENGASLADGSRQVKAAARVLSRTSTQDIVSVAKKGGFACCLRPQVLED